MTRTHSLVHETSQLILQNFFRQLARSARPRVAIAEDRPGLRTALARTLQLDGHEVLQTGTAAGLRVLLSGGGHSGGGRGIDLVVSEVEMAGGSTLELLEDLRRTDWSLPMILLCDDDDGAIHAEARRLGATAVLEKPFEVDQLRTMVNDALRP
jgi:DNA-binding NtrC family response regulator